VPFDCCKISKNNSLQMRPLQIGGNSDIRTKRMIAEPATCLGAVEPWLLKIMIEDTGSGFHSIPEVSGLRRVLAVLRRGAITSSALKS
jgi:hypothetical protein